MLVRRLHSLRSLANRLAVARWLAALVGKESTQQQGPSVRARDGKFFESTCYPLLALPLRPVQTPAAREIMKLGAWLVQG